MRPDDVRAALDALAAEQPDPTADVAAVMARGRRRVVQRRFAFVGIAAVLVAGIAIVGTISHTDHGTTSVSTGPPTTQVNTLAAPRTSSLFPTALEGWKCGNPLQYTDDGGQTWRKIALPAEVPADVGESDTCTAVPDGNVWMTWPNTSGLGMSLLRIRNLTDTQVFSLPSPPANDPNGQLTFIDVDHGWFVTGLIESRRNLYRTVDGGATWTLAAKNAPIGGVAFADTTHGWSINGRALLGTTDGGTTWHNVAVPAPAGAPPDRLSPVSVFAQREAVVVWNGTVITGTQLRPFFDVSNDGGKTWSLRSGPEGFELPQGVNNVFGPTDGSHWALASGPELRITSDGGRSWQPRPNLPVRENVSLAYPMVFPTPDVGWITTQDGVMWRSTDSGRTWTNITHGAQASPTTATTTPARPAFTQARPIGFAFPSPTEGWICGDPPLYSASGAQSSWQFTGNWRNVEVPTPTPATDDTQQSLCAAIPGGDAWFLRASSDPGRPVVDHVHNGAVNSFGFGQLPAGRTIVDLSFADADHGWALSATQDRPSYADLYATNNGGETWSIVGPRTPAAGSLHFTSASDGWAVDNLPTASTPTADVLRTGNRGRTWTTVPVPSPPGNPVPGFGVGITDIAVTPDAIVAFGSKPSGSLTQLFFDVSIDGGRTWALRGAPNHVFGTSEAMAFGATDADHWQLAADNMLWTTADGGKSWTQVAEFAGISAITSVQFVTPNAGYVAGTGQSPNFTSTVALQTLDGGDSWSTIAERSPLMPPNATVVNFPGGIVGCPTHPLAPVPAGNPPSGLMQAAINDVLQSRHWPDASVTATYRVGTHTSETYAGIFAAQVASCGQEAVRSSWVVELYSQGLAPQGNVSQAQLALSYSADGWHVFGFYH